MELQVEYCFWCEERITRPHSLFRWLDSDGMARCLFHPANWDAKALRAKSEDANHQSIEEVAKIIEVDYLRRKAIHEREPMRAVTDNAIITGKRMRTTSRRAAERVLPRTGTIRGRVYSYFVSRGKYGATDEEAQEFLHIEGNTFRPSRKTLVDDGYIVDSGKTRKNAKGNDCVVWVQREATIQDVGDLFDSR